MHITPGLPCSGMISHECYVLKVETQAFILLRVCLHLIIYVG